MERNRPAVAALAMTATLAACPLPLVTLAPMLDVPLELPTASAAISADYSADLKPRHRQRPKAGEIVTLPLDGKVSAL